MARLSLSGSNIDFEGGSYSRRSESAEAPLTLEEVRIQILNGFWEGLSAEERALVLHQVALLKDFWERLSSEERISLDDQVNLSKDFWVRICVENRKLKKSQVKQIEDQLLKRFRERPPGEGKIHKGSALRPSPPAQAPAPPLPTPASAKTTSSFSSVESPKDQSQSTRNNQPHAAQEAQSHSAQLLGQAIQGEYRYSTFGLFLGLATIVGGVILGLNGVAGATSWTAKLLGLESSINDAAPGVVLFIVGIFLVLITRPKVDLKNLKG